RPHEMVLHGTPPKSPAAGRHWLAHRQRPFSRSCPPARCTWIGTAGSLGRSSASLAHAGQAAKRLPLAMPLPPGLTARPRRNGVGMAFSAGFGAHAKTNSTPFDDTVALARGSVAHLRSALTRTFGTDRGDKKGFVTPGGEAGRQGVPEARWRTSVPR